MIIDDFINALDEKIREDGRFTISTLALEFPNVDRTSLHKTLSEKFKIWRIVLTLVSQTTC